jgi:GTP-binding protein
VSALTGERTPRLVEVVDRVAAARRRRVPTPELNRFLARVTAAHPPTSRTEREVRILYGAQTGTAPPSFVLFTNVATEFHFSYERFLVNQLREAFGFEGTPVRLTVRRRARRPSAGAGRRKTRGKNGPAARPKPAAGRDRPGKG